MVYGENGLPRVTESTDPAGNRRTFRYNAAGELIGETDIRGNTVWYEYDVMGTVDCSHGRCRQNDKAFLTERGAFGKNGLSG